MSIEFMDSFETQDTSRYASGSGVQFTGSGRGTGHTGAVGYSGSFTQYAKANVASATTKGQAIAVQTPSSATGLGLGIFHFVESTGTIQHVTIMYNTAGKIEARRGTQSGTLLGTSANQVRVDGSYVHIEAKVTVHSSTGAVEVRADGVAVLSLTGVNTNNGGSGIIDQCWFGDDVGNVRGGVNYDDWVCWDTSGSANNDFLGDVRVGYAAATAGGTYSSGTASSGTLVSCVDDAPSDGDSTYITQDSTGLPKAVSFDLANAPGNTAAILAVAPIAIVRKDDAGTNTGRLLLISGATENDGGADLGVNSSFGAKYRIHETDPNTAAAWSLSGFNAIEVGWRRTA